MTEPVPLEYTPPEAPTRLSPNVPLPILDPNRKSLSEKLFLFDQILGLKSRIDSNLPTLTHSISVSVSGGPSATITRIWQLALATVFGRYRQAGVFGFQGADVKCIWDITGKNVQIVLTYQNSSALGIVNDVINTTPEAFILKGPVQETIGAPVATWLNGSGVRQAAAISGTIGAVIGGVLTRSRAGAQTFGAIAAISAGLVTKAAKTRDNETTQNLPDVDRVITTGQKLDENVQPPAPKYDNLSRTLPLIALISNALTDPGYLPAAPPQRLRPRKCKTKSSKVTTVNLNGNLPNFVSLDTGPVVAAFGGLAVAGLAPQPPSTPASDKDPIQKNTRDDGYPSIPEDVANVQGEINQ